MKCDGYYDIYCKKGFLCFPPRGIITTREELPFGQYAGLISAEHIGHQTLLYGAITQDAQTLNLFSKKRGKPFIQVASLKWDLQYALFHKVDILYHEKAAADHYSVDLFGLARLGLVDRAGDAAGKVLAASIEWKEADGAAKIIRSNREDLEFNDALCEIAYPSTTIVGTCGGTLLVCNRKSIKPMRRKYRGYEEVSGTLNFKDKNVFDVPVEQWKGCIYDKHDVFLVGVDNRNIITLWRVTITTDTPTEFNADISVNRVHFGDQKDWDFIFGSAAFLTLTCLVPDVVNGGFIFCIYCIYSNLTTFILAFPDSDVDVIYGRVLCHGGKFFGNRVQLLVTSYEKQCGHLVAVAYDGSLDTNEEHSVTWISLKGIPWDAERVLWIALDKNDKNNDCHLRKVPKDVMRVIIYEFLDVNHCVSPLVQTRVCGSASFNAPNVRPDKEVSATTNDGAENAATADDIKNSSESKPTVAANAAAADETKYGGEENAAPKAGTADDETEQ